MKFNVGDMVIADYNGNDNFVGKVSGYKYLYARGTKALVTGEAYYNDFFNVYLLPIKWIKENEDGSPVLDVWGDELTQNDGAYELTTFVMEKEYQPIINKKQLPKICL